MALFHTVFICRLPKKCIFPKVACKVPLYDPRQTAAGSLEKHLILIQFHHFINEETKIEEYQNNL